MAKKEENKKERKIAWSYYTRNDEYVKEKFLANKFDTVETTGLGNFDELFAFLLETDFFSLFHFRPDCRERIMIPLVHLLSTYSLKVICRMNSLNQIDSFLFKDRAILQMIGFNGVHFEKGFSRRNKGGHLPFNVSTLGKLIGDFSLSQTNELFRNSLQLLAKKKFAPKGVFAADATPLYVSYSSKKYENAGVILKDGKKRKGYKLITLKYVGGMCQNVEDERENQEAEIFVSAIVVPLNHHEGPYLIPLIQQAIENIGEGKIKMIVADRGFMSGENLWEVKHKYKIDFLIYSKSNMDVTKELKNQMADYKEREKKNLPLPKNYFFQKDKKTEVYGFNNLSWFWTYGDADHQEHLKKNLYKKKQEVKTHPISGGIITKYKGKERYSPITLLSSKKFCKSFTPLLSIYFYRKRHHTENEGYRELKQGYKIGKFPSQTFSGVRFHTIFTLLIYNFITCYKTEKGGKTVSLGLTRIHREISWYGAILYAYPHFGIFELKEVVGWLGYKGKGMRAPPSLFFPSILYSKKDSS